MDSGLLTLMEGTTGRFGVRWQPRLPQRQGSAVSV